MGKRKYELDTRVLRVFFFVAMPFVALGSFLVVRMLFGRSHQRRGYWTLPALKGKAPGGREVLLAPARLVGYAPVEQVPNVKWLVVVEQELEEATAPIAGVTRYLWIHFIGAFGTVILLALYFSFRAETPVIEEELHLHEEHLPGSMKSARS